MSIYKGDTLIAGSGYTIKELWTNSSPTSNFNAQTVSIDLSNYDAIIVLATIDNSSNYNSRVKTSIFAEVGSYSNMIYGARTDDRYVGIRTFDVSTSGVAFSVGYNQNSWSSWISTTAWCVPYKILGVKY